jgi:hypothetical protein
LEKHSAAKQATKRMQDFQVLCSTPLRCSFLSTLTPSDVEKSARESPPFPQANCPDLLKRKLSLAEQGTACFLCTAIKKPQLPDFTTTP